MTDPSTNGIQQHPNRGGRPPTTAGAEPAPSPRPPVEPMLIDDRAAAALAGVSRSHWHTLRAAGKLPPAVRLGRKVLWRRSELVAWIEASCPDSKTWAAMQASNRRLRVIRVS